MGAMMTNIDAPQSGRSVTSKIVAILDAFSADTPRLSLQGLAERTGLPQSTTYRLASELVEWGGLERGSGGYQIGLRLWEIGELARRGEQLRDVALPFMQDLYDATHENVHLAVRRPRSPLHREDQRSARGACGYPAGRQTSVARYRRREGSTRLCPGRDCVRSTFE